LRAIAEAGYVTPTPIQEQAIPIVLMGRDVLGCAQTGTGKTASFTLPMIDVLASGRARARMPRSLIVEPTRELATQVAESFDRYGKYHPLSKALLIGGESFSDQEKALDRGVDVLIATPGRLLDLFERGKILMSDVKILVIDEADRMLDMGFIPDVERIVSLLPKLRQTLFFSATMPPEIRRLADAFLMNPKTISVSPPTSPAATVIQCMVIVNESDKIETLRQLLRNEDVRNALIFCNRKRDVDILHRALVKHGLDAVALHGDMPQSKRTETLERFKRGDAAILVASDVAARGLDIQGLSHVFNYDVPMHPEDYIHRIGRTGRAGREGRAFTLAMPEDGRCVDAIQRLIGRDIPRLQIEGLPTLELSMEDRPRGGRGGGARRPSGARSSATKSPGPTKSQGSTRRSAPAKEAAPTKVVTAAEDVAPVQPVPPAPQLESIPEARPIPEPKPQPRSPARPAPVRAHSRPQARPHDDGEPDVPVLAFGDHMPEFLRRPVPKPAATSDASDAS